MKIGDGAETIPACHPEAAAAPEGQSAPKDPQPETRTGRWNVDYSAAQPGCNLGVLRPSYAASSLRDSQLRRLRMTLEIGATA